MAEVLAGFSALSSFLQLVDFSVKVVATATELRNASKDALRENIETELLARQYEDVAYGCTKALAEQPQKYRHIAQLAKSSQDEANRLLVLLQSLQIDAQPEIKRAVQSARKAVATVKHQKEIDRHRRRLQELNTLLATAMLQDLWKQNKSNAERQFQDPSQVGTNNVEQVKILLDRHYIRNIMKALHYTEMHLRRNRLEDAWPETLEWSLQDEGSGLLPWLRYGEGLFWISGKAGSGKSTLMKYLCENPRTEVQLKQWSGARKLICANFFFWWTGTPLQQNITGLLMSILYQVLWAAPSLGKIVFRHRLMISPDGQEDDLALSPFKHDELVAALRAIARYTELGSVANLCFCFFIDGLDEFSAGPGTLFRNAFETQVPNLKLEKLTRPDILQYIRDKVGSALAVTGSTSSDEEKLVIELADKAEGVFLWVILAVKSLCDGVTEGDDIEFLRYRVQQLPTDLGEFFRSILQRVDPVYKHQTYQSLFLAWLQSADASLDDGRFQPRYIRPFGDYWLIRQCPEGLVDSQFSQKATIKMFSKADASKMAKETITFLSACTKDLLWLPESGNFTYSSHDSVDFLHRSVFDFLSTREMQELLKSQVPSHFRDSQILRMLDLHRLKYRFSADNVVQVLGHVADRSLCVAISEWCRQLADELKPLASRLRACEHDKWLRHPQAIAVLISFHENDVSLLALRALHLSGGWDVSRPDELASCRQAIWLAALGEDPRNMFSIKSIHPYTLEWLIDHGSDSLPSANDEETDFCECQRSALEIFLRKWARATPPVYDHASAHEWQRVWDIAKKLLFSSAGPVVQEGDFFCIGTKPDGSAHVHEWQNLDHFLATHWPDYPRAGLLQLKTNQQ